jgi:hypothetical protein
MYENGDTICCTRTVKGVIEYGGADRTGLGHETYSGERSRLHEAGKVARLEARHGRSHFYCLPLDVRGRGTIPFTPNGPAQPQVAPVPPRPTAPADVIARVERWMRQNREQMFILPPVWDDIQTLIDTTKEQ